MLDIDKNSLAKRFGKLSDVYESVTPVQEKMAQTLLDRSWEYLSGKKILSILEIGCGTGRLTRQLVELFPEAQITAIDISHGMIAHAKSCCDKASYVVADAEEYIHSLKDKFDLIISSATIQWFTEPQSALTKAKELLSLGGFMAIATFANRTFYELSSSFDNAYDVHNLERREHIVPMKSIQKWREIISDSEIYDEIVTKEFVSVRDFLRSIQEAGAVNSLKKRSVIPANVLKTMSQYYSQNYANPENGKIKSTYHVCYVFYSSAWI